MKANQAQRRLSSESSGVSSVVSAVLVFALFSSAFGMWMFTQFPTWVADRESNHQDSVRAGFADLQAGIERLSASDSAGPISASVPLTARQIPLLGGIPTSGHLFMETGVDFAAAFTGPRLHVIGDAAAGTPTAAPQTITGVETLTHLHLSLDSSIIVNGDDQGWIRAQLTDGTRTFTATLIHGGSTIVPDCAGRGIALSVTTDTGTRQHTLLCDAGAGVTDFTVDILEIRFGFAGRLGELDPFSIAITTGQSGSGSPTGSGTFLAVWNTDGHNQVAGTGTSTPGYALSRSGSRLSFEPSRAEATPESLAWEYGAVTAHQRNADGLSMTPSMDLAIVNGVGTLRWTLTQLTGSGDLSGAGSATVEVTHQQTDEVVLSAAGATLTLDTPGAAAWRSELSAVIQAAGAGSDATVSGTGTEAILTLSSATVSEWVLQLRIIDASVNLR